MSLKYAGGLPHRKQSFEDIGQTSKVGINISTLILGRGCCSAMGGKWSQLAPSAMAQICATIDLISKKAGGFSSAFLLLRAGYSKQDNI